jgi:cytidylate kinase
LWYTLGGGFHVRLVASREKRLKHLQEYCGLSEKKAAERMRSTDEDRREYVHDVFGKDVGDIASYDCIVNTTWLSYEAAAGLIAAHLLGQR